MLSDQARLRAVTIIQTINRVRDEHHACTGREVARLLKIDFGYFQRTIEQMRAAGLVNWTRVQGSLIATAAGVEFAAFGVSPGNVLIVPVKPKPVIKKRAKPRKRAKKKRASKVAPARVKKPVLSASS